MDKAASAGEGVVTREDLSRQSGQGLGGLSPCSGDILDTILHITDVGSFDVIGGLFDVIGGPFDVIPGD